MNYETEYELTNGLCVTQVVVDYEVVWAEDMYEERYSYAEVMHVWALLKSGDNGCIEGVMTLVDVFPVLHWRDMEELVYHCEKHYARMVEEGEV